ncbi:hypothetical protein GCM10027073_39890 [Streptomyces chlorus]
MDDEDDPAADSGFCADSTCGSFSRSATAGDICEPNAVSCCRPSCSTIWLLYPPACGSCRWRTSTPCWDWESGSVKLSEYVPPTERLVTWRATRATSQARKTITKCRAHHSSSRRSAPPLARPPLRPRRASKAWT